MGAGLSNWKAAAFDCCLSLVLPTHCVLCGAGTRDARFCAPCFAMLPRMPEARCRICAVALASGSVCGECLRNRPAYDSVRAIYAYEFPVDALIHAYKYGGDLPLATVLAAELAATSAPRIDALVAMPLSAARLRSRGYNQAQELARIVGRKLGLPVLAHACRKVRDTPPQASLEWAARARNVRGAFACDVDLSGCRVGVVDDVMTTGATLGELARVLKRAGAAEVRGLVVARTLRTN